MYITLILNIFVVFFLHRYLICLFFDNSFTFYRLVTQNKLTIQHVILIHISIEMIQNCGNNLFYLSKCGISNELSFKLSCIPFKMARITAALFFLVMPTCVLVGWLVCVCLCALTINSTKLTVYQMKMNMKRRKKLYGEIYSDSHFCFRVGMCVCCWLSRSYFVWTNG